MLHPFFAEEIARERMCEARSGAARAGLIAGAAGPGESGLRTVVGNTLVRIGLRLAGGSATTQRGPAQADPTCL